MDITRENTTWAMIEPREFTVLTAALVLFYLGIVVFIQSHFLLSPAFPVTEPLETYVYMAKQDAALFPGDVTTNFRDAMHKPYLYEFLHHAWLSAGGELYLLHKIMGAFIWLSTLILAGWAGWKILGATGLLGTVFFTILHSNIFLYQAISAETHSFAMPFIFGALLCVLYGRPMIIAALAVLSALLYPGITVNLGVSWAVMLLWDRRQAIKTFPVLTLLKIGAIVAPVGALCILLAYASVFQPELSRFNRTLDDAAISGIEIPVESEINDTIFFNDSRPFRIPFYVYIRTFAHNQGEHWAEIDDYFQTHGMWDSRIALSYLMIVLTFGVFLSGLFYCRRCMPDFYRKLLLYLASNFFLLVFFFLIWPEHIYRFLIYPFLPLLVMLIPAGLYALVRKYINAVNSKAIVFILFLMIAPLYSVTKPYAYGFLVYRDNAMNAVFETISRLPEESVIAVWPFHMGDMVPYFSGRISFIHGIAYWDAFYTDQNPRLRSVFVARMLAFLEAYYGRDKTGLIDLRDDWGVDFIVVDKRHLSGDQDKKPWFDFPYVRDRHEALRAENQGQYWLLNPPRTAITAENEYYILLDLNRL